MTSNRQPKDRLYQYNRLMEKVPAMVEDAENRLMHNTLWLNVSHSRDGKIQSLNSINVFPPQSCWLKWLGHCSDNNVCRHCYGCGAQCTYRQSMTKTLVNNMVLMNSEVKDNLVPLVVGPTRHYAFGDCHSRNMALWSIAIAKKNKSHSQHIVFTKTNFYNGFKHIPSNMTIIYSNSIIDDVKPSTIANVCKTFTAVTAIEPYLYDNRYYICHDKCINCYLHNEGCFNKYGPSLIVRLLQ